MEPLTFEPLDASHGAELLALWTDEAVVRYTNMELPCPLEEAERRAAVLARFDSFAVRRAGELVGVAGCPAVDAGARRFGLFYQFKRTVWGLGYGTRTVGWLLEFMAAKYGSAGLLADVAAENRASERILRRFRFVPCGEEPFTKNGTEYTVRHFQRTVGQWTGAPTCRVEN